MNKKKQWFKFHSILMDYNLYYKGEILPKFIAFWNGYKAEDLISNKLKITSKKK
jgi:hypothetical protein